MTYWGIKMTEPKHEDDMLDALFDAARKDPPEPAPDLMARVLGDALAEQRPAPRPVPAPRVSILRELVRTLGGWPAMAGLMTATATGVWLGISPPVFLQDTTGAYLGIGDAASLIDGGAGFGFDLFEEAL